MNALAQRCDLAHTTRGLYARGWMPGTSGNVSVRDGPDHFVITGSGLPKGQVAETDCVRVLLETCQATEDTARPSAETRIHAAIYRATGAGAVVHVHSPHATAVSYLLGDRAERRAVSFVGWELLKGLHASASDVPIFPNWDDVGQIAAEVETDLRECRDRGEDPPPALLLTAHGMTVWAETLTAARDRAECVESLCEVMLLAGLVSPADTPGAPTTALTLVRTSDPDGEPNQNTASGRNGR